MAACAAKARGHSVWYDSCAGVVAYTREGMLASFTFGRVDSQENAQCTPPEFRARHSELVSCGCHTIVLAFNPHSLLPELHHIVYCNAPQPRLMPLFVCVISSVFSCEA